MGKMVNSIFEFSAEPKIAKMAHSHLRIIAQFEHIQTNACTYVSINVCIMCVSMDECTHYVYTMYVCAYIHEHQA